MSGNASDPSTWAPPGESAADLWLERSNFNSVILSGVAYGIHFTLFLIVVHHLVRHPPNTRANGKPRIPWGLVAYVSWNFFLGTIGIAAEGKFNQMTFIDDRNYPGGPNAFVAEQYGDFINIFGTVAYVILNWFADGLVIYRFWLIYNFNYYVAILPILLLLGSFCMGVILLFQLTQPNANLWTVTTVNFGIPYWSISAGLNILVTSLIVARLWMMRRRTRAVLTSNHTKTYTSVAAMLIESAALYSFLALVFIITYARDSNVQNLVLPVLGQVQAISPLLIMWRVALGQAISRTVVVGGATTNGPTTISKISWKQNTGYTGTQPNTTMSAVTHRQSISLPPFRTGKDALAGDGDSDSWEMSDRGDNKMRGVEVVVEREVQQWEADGSPVRTNAV